MKDTQLEICSAREAKLKRALFRGDQLCLTNPIYFRAVQALLEELSFGDIGDGDLTVKALGSANERAAGRVLAKEPGVVAGIDEYSWLLNRAGIRVQPRKKDGDLLQSDETIAEIDGERGQLLAYERVGLNLLQRMSGIATTTRRLQELVHRCNPGTHVVGTRKTPCGLLDKRAIHLGGGGTHRLGLADAILVKNNHLALLADREAEAVCEAVRRAWPFRQQAGFIEVEVRSKESALAAARIFRSQEQDSMACPCLLLLDNMLPEEVSCVLAALRAESLLEHVLIEVSGNIFEGNMEPYAACGVDAISVGALTHSPRVLDICQRIQ